MLLEIEKVLTIVSVKALKSASGAVDVKRW